MKEQYPTLQSSSGFVGREKELGILKQHLDDCLRGRGRTIIVTGEAGVGKTRLINEFIGYAAREKDVQCSTGECISEVSAPYLPFTRALQKVQTRALIPSVEAKNVGIEEIFLINNAGIVLSHASRKKRTIDTDVVGGMISAIGDFVKVSFQDRDPVSGLGRLDYGAYKILIEHGPIVFTAAVTTHEIKELRTDLRALINTVEEEYQELLKEWDGDYARVRGMHELIQPLMAKRYTVEERKEPSVLEAERIRMYEQVVQAIQKTAKEKPLILFIESLHWADESSLKLLHYISRNIRNSRVMAIGAYRPEDKSPILDETLHEMGMERLFTDLNLECLGENDVVGMITCMFPNIKIREDVAKKLYQETGGNPFFLQALLQTLHSHDAIYKAKGQWVMGRIDEIDMPHSIRDAVLRRFDRLGVTQQKMLQYASAIGEQFDFITLRKTLGMDEESLVDHLDQLLKSGMIEELPDEVGIYRFDNSGMREIIYDELSSMRKKLTAQKIAEVLEEQYRDKLGEIAGRLATHYYVAMNYEKALIHAETAGEECELACSPREATGYYKIALKSLEKFEPTLINKTKKMRITDRVAYMYYVLGDWDKSLDYTRRTMALGIETKNQALVAESYRNMGMIQIAKAEYTKALANLQNALRISEEISETLGIAEAHYHIGRINWRIGKLDEALSSLTRCLTLARSGDNKPLMAKALMDIGIIYNTKGEYNKSQENTMKSLSISEALGNKYEVARAYNGVGVTYDWMGDIDKAIEWWEKSIKICGKIGFIRGLGYGLSNLAGTYPEKGWFDKAEDYTRRAEEIFEKLGEKKMLSAIHRNYGIIYRYKKEWDKSASYFENSIKLAKKINDLESLPQSFCEFGKMYKNKGEKARAVEQFQNAIEVYKKLGNAEKVTELRKELETL